MEVKVVIVPPGAEDTNHTTGWNPYFVSYAIAHGTTPQKLINAAHAEGRTAVMEFALWMSPRLREWRKAHGPTYVNLGPRGPRLIVPESAYGGPCGPLEQAHFAGWLRGTAMRMAEENEHVR
jgi:hypothetical protein